MAFGAASTVLAVLCLLSGVAAQSSILVCESNTFRCRNGVTCLYQPQVCDGVKHCGDGSDEDWHFCMRDRYKRCTQGQFSCRFGGCTSRSNQCNFRVDCHDGSDEASDSCSAVGHRVVYPQQRPPTSPRPSTCHKQQFRCGDGRCLSIYSACNGVVECPDGTDESDRVCSSQTCASFHFRCAYGACIDNNLRCNGRRDCADGSDEKNCFSPSTTTTTTTRHPPPRPPTKPVTNPPIQIPICFRPRNVMFGSFTAFNCDGCTERDVRFPEGTMIIFNCNSGYLLRGASSTRCLKSGTWSDREPACIREHQITNRPPSTTTSKQVFNTVTCPPLSGVKGTRIKCSRSGREHNCVDGPSTPGTRADVSCSSGYEPTGRSNTTLRMCKANGQWTTSTFSCIVECGISVSLNNFLTPLIAEGQPVQPGQWPWHAAVYVKGVGNNKWDYLCGGSLISEHAIITAAHCVTEMRSRNTLAETDLKIALAKKFREYNNVNDDEFVRRFDVASISVNKDYNPLTFESDLAILVLTEPAEINFYIRPVCIGEIAASPGTRGTIVGWGMDETGRLSDALQWAELVVVNSTVCRKNYQDVNPSPVRSTTLCAGLNGPRVCSGDSGGGFVFQSQTQTGKRIWRLHGITSTSSYVTPCDSTYYNIFTKVNSYATWIKNMMRDVSQNIL